MIATARLAGLYAVFGAAATVANLAGQALCHMIVAPSPGAADLPYWGALAVGTGIGLVVKYLLDKRWIFHDRSRGLAAHGRRFSLYTMMGLGTTVIFWGGQTLSYWIGGTQTALYVGGALSLAIGYVVKYQLDKRFVFDGAPA